MSEVMEHKEKENHLASPARLDTMFYKSNKWEGNHDYKQTQDATYEKPKTITLWHRFQIPIHHTLHEGFNVTIGKNEANEPSLQLTYSGSPLYHLSEGKLDASLSIFEDKSIVERVMFDVNNRNISLKKLLDELNMLQTGSSLTAIVGNPEKLECDPNSSDPCWDDDWLTCYRKFEIDINDVMERSLYWFFDQDFKITYVYYWHDYDFNDDMRTQLDAALLWFDSSIKDFIPFMFTNWKINNDAFDKLDVTAVQNNKVIFIDVVNRLRKEDYTCTVPNLDF